MAQKQVVVIAGPTGSGKDSIIAELVRRYSNCVRLITSTTRAPRPGEQNGVDYHFFSKERFLEELRNGNIIEYNYRPSLDTYYGTYIPELEKQLEAGKTVLAQVQIVGARYLKEHYAATTIFVNASSLQLLVERIQERDRTLSPEETEARLNIALQEVKEDAPQYDYQVVNEQGRLLETVDSVVEILEKEGYTLVS